MTTPSAELPGHEPSPERAATRELPWPPESITDISEMDRITGEAHDKTDELVVVSDGVTPEILRAAFDEEMYAARQALMRSDESGRLTAQACAEDAYRLDAYLNGDESQAEFVEMYVTDRRETLFDTLDTIEDGGSTRVAIAEAIGLDVTNDDDQEAINASELKLRNLARLRKLQVEENGSPTGIDQAPFEPPPTDSQGKLYKYEREHLGEYHPDRIGQFVAFVDAQIRVHHKKLQQARQSNPDATYQDTVVGVLGNGGKAVEFLAKLIRDHDGQPMESDKMLTSSFSEFASRYFNYDVTDSDPDYYRDFRSRV